jgi:hypothetical protein
MDEDVPWMYSIVAFMLIFMWVVGAVVFGVAHVSAQVSAHRGAALAARGGNVARGGLFGSAYGGWEGGPSWEASPDALRWGQSGSGGEVPYASWTFGRPMEVRGGAVAGLEQFYAGPPKVYE